jgi:ribosome-binding ATPase YchF (GTP1/OBG family)
MGKGLGNQFLSVAAQSDALLHVVDASGSVDKEGRVTETGIGDPIADFADVELELVLWYTKMFSSNMGKIAKAAKQPGADVGSAVADVMQGIGVKKEHVNFALKEALLEGKDIESWTEKETQNFCWILRDISKPTIIIANKMDLPNAAENFKKLREHYKDFIVVPTSGEAELSLRRAESKGYIKYVPGEERFDIMNPQELTDAQRTALAYIRRKVFGEYLKSGHVLPDVYLLPAGSTLDDLARTVHSDLHKGLLYAVDVRTGIHLPTDYVLRDRDVLSIVSTARRG